MTLPVQWVARIPIATTFLLQFANASQLVRMWTERSAVGQSILGWSMVNLALVLYFVYYRVMLPAQKLPQYCTAFGIAMNAAVIGTAAYFRAGA